MKGGGRRERTRERGSMKRTQSDPAALKMEEGPQGKECRWLLEASKARKHILLWKEHGRASTWILAHRDLFETSGTLR